MKARAMTAILLLASLAAWAAPPPRDYAGIVAEMKERVAHAKPADRGKLLAELVRYEAELMRQQFKAGANNPAVATLADMERDAQECEKAAVGSGKNLKNIDITLREAARVLDDYRRGADVEFQPMLKHTSDVLEEVRNAVLNRMFAPERKK